MSPLRKKYLFEIYRQILTSFYFPLHDTHHLIVSTAFAVHDHLNQGGSRYLNVLEIVRTIRSYLLIVLTLLTKVSL